MTNLVRFNPFDISAFDNRLEELMRDFVRPLRHEMLGKPQVTLDISENDKAYTVRAEMPGVNKEDINVTINGNQVAISAEVKKEKEEKEGEKLLRSERYYGSMYRSFTLAQDVDETESQAKYADGVLTLTLPKKAVTAAKKLAIK
ncbi:MAG: Hsp20/alpha crystallin family protein [Gammaproteobacteria bacterium]|nr:Hsp20/alpha crystallin family protein [Gammaproteobacteria bacterium]